MMVLSLLLRVADAVVKTWEFKEVSVSRPYVIDMLCVISIENTYTVFQNSDVAETYRGRCTGMLLRSERDLIDEILIGGYVVVIPRAYAVAGDTGTAHIYICGRVLHDLHIGGYIGIAPVCIGIRVDDP